MAKKTKAKAVAKKKTTGVDFVVRSRVKEAIAKNKCQSSSDVVDALNNIVGWYLEQGAARAKANKRKTVRAYDIMA